MKERKYKTELINKYSWFIIPPPFAIKIIEYCVLFSTHLRLSLDLIYIYLV